MQLGGTSTDDHLERQEGDAQCDDDGGVRLTANLVECPRIDSTANFMSRTVQHDCIASSIEDLFHLDSEVGAHALTSAMSPKNAWQMLPLVVVCVPALSTVLYQCLVKLTR